MNIPLLIPGLGLVNNEMNMKPYLLGPSVSFEELVPGERYYRRTLFGFMYHYDLIEIHRKENNSYTYEFVRDRTMYPINAEGNPLSPYEVPNAPLPPGFVPPIQTFTDVYDPTQESFFKVSTVKKGRHFVGPVLQRKVARNTRRRALNNELEKKGLPTETGRGPANLIRKYLNLQPPKGAKGGSWMRRPNHRRRKTRRHA